MKTPSDPINWDPLADLLLDVVEILENRARNDYGAELAASTRAGQAVVRWLVD